MHKSSSSEWETRVSNREATGHESQMNRDRDTHRLDDDQILAKKDHRKIIYEPTVRF